jgi:single-strand DNA-binding protein
MSLGDLNKVQLIGRLGRDPEIRRTQDGTPIASLSVATGEGWRDKQTGERRERTEWHRIVVWGRPDGKGLTAMIDTWLQKGDQVYIEGELQTRKWQDQSGADKFTTEIVVRNWGHTVKILKSKKMDANRAERTTDGGPPVDTTPGREESLQGAPAPGGRAPMDDDIPF